MSHFPRVVVVALTVLEACASPAPSSDPPGAAIQEFTHLIRERKAAAARGDSVAWLRAASPHPSAVCADAGGRLRKCRPDFGSPTEWQLRTAIESVQVSTVGSIAIVTYRETDTIHVGTETVHSPFRYVETYRKANAGWELLAFAEIQVPPPRIAVPGNIARYPLYEGSYPSGTYTLTVSRIGEHLAVAASGETPDTLFALTPTTFFARGDPGEYEFVQSGKDVATELLYRINGQALHFRRRGR